MGRRASRGGGFSSSQRASPAPPSRSSSSVPATRTQQRAPAPAPAAAAPAQVAPQQPSMMAGIAQTAAGVAVGHVAAHGIMSAMGMGGGGRGEEAAAAAPAPPPLNQGGWDQSNQNSNPCAAEMQAFMACASKQNDMSFCTAFNDQYKDCKIRYGLS